MATTEMTFGEFCQYMTDTVEKKVIRYNDDQVILWCGYEGTGKSTSSIALLCEIYRRRGLKPVKEFIFYEWEEYLKTNLAAMLQQLDSYPLELIAGLIAKYKINITDVKKNLESYPVVQKGDVLIFDEAGTQAHNREAMSSKSIQLVKLMISNRFLNLLHILNVPKPGSIDLYIREERARFLVWCDAYYTENWEYRVRNLYVYSKSSYNDILCTKGWYYYFSNTNKLIKRFPPDLHISLKNENLLDYIPKDIHEYYLARKNIYNIRQVLDMLVDKKDAKEQSKKDKQREPPHRGETIESRAHKYDINTKTARDDFIRAGITPKHTPKRRTNKKVAVDDC